MCQECGDLSVPFAFGGAFLLEKMDALNKLKQFDAYPKTLEDFRVKTWGGATGERLFLKMSSNSSESFNVHRSLAAEANNKASRISSPLNEEEAAEIKQVSVLILSSAPSRPEQKRNANF